MSKISERGGIGHLGGDAVVAEVADASYMGVADFPVGLEGARIDFLSHCLVGVTERSAGQDAAVDLLYSEQIVVER